MGSVHFTECTSHVPFTEIKGIYMGFACFQTAIQFFTLVNAMVFIKQHQIKAKTCQPRKDF